MAGESIVQGGTYTSLIASEAEIDGAFSTISAALSAVLTDGSENFQVLDFRFNHTVGTPTLNGRIDLYRVASDGTNQAQTPSATYPVERVGWFTLNAAAPNQFYYLSGIENIHETDKFIWQNNDGSVTLTGQLFVRGRTLNTL